MLASGAGNDTVIGHGGDDVLVGGAGTDTLTGGAAGDTFVFGAGDGAVGSGRDVISDFTQGSDRIDLQQLGAVTYIGGSQFSGTAGEVRSVAFDGTTIVEFDSDGDGTADFQVQLAGQMNLSASDFVEVLAAPTAGDDNIRGSGRNDNIQGLGGNDSLFGLGGADRLDGGTGNDLLVGGSGVDTLTGGPGSDLFRLDLLSDSLPGFADLITDFTSGEDQIDISALGEFSFIGRREFSATGPELRYDRGRDVTLIEGDSNGDGMADFQLELVGSVHLRTGDFIL